MIWNDPNETEQEYFDRKRAESQSATGVLFTLSGLFIIAFKFAVIFGTFIFLAYSMSEKLFSKETGSLQIWGFTLLLTYLIFCIIYFLKGIMIGLRSKRGGLWIIPWLICVVICCVLPAYMVKILVSSQFLLSNRDSLWCIVLSWGAFAFSLFYIYNIYQFNTPNAPGILRWVFSLGIKISRRNKSI